MVGVGWGSIGFLLSSFSAKSSINIIGELGSWYILSNKCNESLSCDLLSVSNYSL